MQICTLTQTDNHASTPPLSFLQARCPSCHPNNSIKARRAWLVRHPGQLGLLCPEKWQMSTRHSAVISAAGEQRQGMAHSICG